MVVAPLRGHETKYHKQSIINTILTEDINADFIELTLYYMVNSTYKCN